ncbi:hypothetical protein QBC38DRAFT_464785 [Podospora fimiseda]|uniref:Uncharacterized protein n=1 Tax=Podospora fimiseda TaxID=252190 RepID=A0AAN7BYK9_9PEZI|nr:hypothetical protein QBC38DRAFT_464785 [Podospora fimiseda]
MKPGSILWRGAVICVACMTTTASSTTDDLALKPIEPSTEAAKQNAFQIFNAIHSAMRQWGSSLNHNGLSAFLVTVPADTILHHGTSHPEPPTGPEWLAFDIEHAEQFARSRMGPPPPIDANQNPPMQQLWHLAQRQPPVDQTLEKKHGYLHIYTTMKPLRLLYLDGMSAGNTNMGTLDTQDFLLRGDRHVPIWEEYERAKSLCDILTPLGLDGVIRMEFGFEIINCQFSWSMRLLKAYQRPDNPDTPSNAVLLENVRAISQRYHGIGAGRAVVDFSSMVSAMFYPVNLTNPDPTRSHLPRLTSVTDDQLRAIKTRILDVVRDRVDGRKASIDWQGVTDMIIARYADRLWSMTEKVDSLEVLKHIVSGLLNTHIDYALDDHDRYDRARDTCAAHYLQQARTRYLQFPDPWTDEDLFIASAISSVTGSICDALFEVRKLIVEDTNANEKSLASAKKIIKSLNEKLRWSRWKECTTCSFDEVCFVPMWPFGDKDSYERPNCRNVATVKDGWMDNQYWEPRWGGHAAPEPPAKTKTGWIGPSEDL